MGHLPAEEMPPFSQIPPSDRNQLPHPITDPAFLEAVRGLERSWRALPRGGRAHFPLRRDFFLPRHRGDRDGDAAAGTGQGRDFAADFVAFCDRWALTGLASWELPEPQEPLFLRRPDDARPHVPGCVLHILLPVFYPVRGSDDLVREILKRQEDLAASAGIHPGAAGLPHYRFHARLLVAAHLERVISSRYGLPNRIPGFVQIMKAAIAQACGVGTDQVDRWRKAISTRRRG
jgi:hypothetical protein